MSNTDDTKAMIEVMQAYVDGAEIEVTCLGDDALGKDSVFSWDWDKNDYRIKPKTDRLTELLMEAHEHVMTPREKWELMVRRVRDGDGRGDVALCDIKQRATELFGPCPEDVVKGCETCATSYTNNGSGEACHKAQCWERAGFPEWTPKQHEKSCETCRYAGPFPSGTCRGCCNYEKWEPQR